MFVALDLADEISTLDVRFICLFISRFIYMIYIPTSFDITSIALVTLEIINNTLLINELRLWFVCRELMGNLAAGKHSHSQCEAPG